ncbi:zinc-dependent peptidase [Halobacteriovorax sp. HLS]|uniref:zinc-dependent peptidase n=1 Tax=Halobacteriovorax sp. HLS TaxID=2234000 RepID=UPI000FDB19DF|nr:zinc-dependent peptidase [Halobacteriovorax sp. HLS]
METSTLVGIGICSVISFVIIKLLLALKKDTRFLKYDFPSGWENKIEQRYALYSHLDQKQKSLFKRKVQMLIAKRKIQGLEGLTINIDIRLALACEISFVSMTKKSLYPYKKISPIALLPFDKYEEFKNRGSHTLFWDSKDNTLYLENESNQLLKSSYYLWLKVDSRFSKLSHERLLEISNSLSSSKVPDEQDLFPILENLNA